jgi:two-component system sensor histidine kinase ChiS
MLISNPRPIESLKSLLSVMFIIMKHLGLFLGVLITISPYAYSQHSDLTFEHFNVDKGMPAYVSYILQDRTGYLWFATWSGLYKYDGYNFISYKHDLDDTTSIIDNTLSTLYEDKAGVLWIGSWLGLEKFDYTTNTFIHYIPNPSDTGKGDCNSVWAICEDKYGVLWVGTGDGLYKFNRATGKFTRLQYDSTDTGSISHNAINSIYEDKEGLLWFGTSAGLDKLDFKTGKFIHYWLETGDRSKIFWNNNSKYLITAICEDDAGIIWLGTNGGLVEFNPKAGTFFNYRFNPKNPQNRITSICQDVVTGSLWITGWNGVMSLLNFDKKLKKFTPYNCDGVSIISERSGTLWIGSGIEIRKLNRIKQLFKKYSSNDVISYIKNGNEGILWVVTPSGLKKFDIRKGKFIPYSFGKDTLIDVTNNGELLIGTDKGGIYGMDTLRHITLSYDSTWKEFISSVSYYYKTAKGYLAGTLSGGLYFLDPKTKRITKIKNLKQIINYIYEDTFGWLWIGTYMGKLFCYNQALDTLIEFISDPKNPSSISGRQINDIYEDKKGGLWFATINGLNRFERSTNSFIHFTEKSGLPSNNVRGILEDDHGYLWLNTSKGISKFDPENNHFKNFDVSYGLELASDIFYGSGCKTRNGEMYFPGAKGFTRFHPDSVKDNPFIPPIVITSFRKFDKPYPFSNEVRLPHDENFISFEFAALSYISPERNQYAYKMEGLDKNWIYSGTRRYASYPNLDPGQYVFRVKGSNNDGVWNEEGTSITVIITPPFWATWWFRIPAIIALLGIVGETVRYVEKRKLMRRIEQLELERALENERARISQDMHDEVGSSLSEISILGELARKKPEEAETYIQQISERAAEVIDSVSEIVWAMNPSNDTLDSLVARVRRDAVKYLGLANISCRFAVPDVVPGLPLHAELRRNLFLVVKEALHNIVKHSAATEVSISVRCMEGNLEILVSDNGKGFVLDDRLGTGNGLNSMNKRIRDVGGTLRIDSMPGRGTLLAIQTTLKNCRPTDLPNSKY